MIRSQDTTKMKKNQHRGIVFHDSLVKKELHHRGQNSKYKMLQFRLWTLLSKAPGGDTM